jgi:DNA polymerase-4
LPVRKLPGVGPRFEQKLERYGIANCQDARNFGLHELLTKFGSSGHRLYSMSMGDYDSEVRPSRERKTISIERTFAQDFASPQTFSDSLPQLMESLIERYGRLKTSPTVLKRSVKLKFEDFTQTTVETSLSGTKGIFSLEEYQRLACIAWQRRKLPVRLIGLGLGLKPDNGEAQQLSLPLIDTNGN